MTLAYGREIHLSVISGAVTLKYAEHTVWVPAGHEVWLPAGSGPQLPMRRDASTKLQTLVRRFNRGDASVVDALLSEIAPTDIGTLWNLLMRTEGGEALRVRRRITELHAQDSAIRRALQEDFLYPVASD